MFEISITGEYNVGTHKVTLTNCQGKAMHFGHRAHWQPAFPSVIWNRDTHPSVPGPPCLLMPPCLLIDSWSQEAVLPTRGVTWP